MSHSIPHLLAIDAGLHTGLALYSQDASLLWYRSHHLPTQGKLKKAVSGILERQPLPTHLIVEGGGPLFEVWAREAKKRQLHFRQIHAPDWRSRLLLERQQRSGPEAKQHAIALARRVIETLGDKRPTSLRHDAAEAVLIGLYGILEMGWLKKWPPEKR